MLLTYDYDEFNKKGLLKLTKQFDKEGLPVAEVKSDNKPKRETGFQVKTAMIMFESGQKLEIKAKAGGNIFQWKLNNKILPVKNYMQLDTAMKEVVSFVKDNEPNYQKQKEKQLAKTKVAVPTIKPVNTTVAEQTVAYHTTLEELAGQNEALSSQISEVANQANMKQTELDALSAQIASENERTKALEAQLENAKQGIFESAGGTHKEVEVDESQIKENGVIKLGDRVSLQDGREAEVTGKNGKKVKIIILESASGSIVCSECGQHLDTCDESSTGFKCSNCERECQSDGTAIMESGDAVAAICPECGAKMQECEGGMECPECGCKTDADGMVLESTKIDGGMMCDVCNVTMESCNDGYKCPECGQISVAKGDEGAIDHKEGEEE